MKKEDLESLKHLSMIEAAKQLKISKSTLQRKCREFNISFTLKEKNSAEKIDSTLTPNYLKACADLGKTLEDVVKETGISRSAVSQKLHEFKISFRKIKFDLDAYKQAKKEGVLDKEFVKTLDMSISGLRHAKEKFNIEKGKRNWEVVAKEDLEKYYLVERLPVKVISEKLNKSVSNLYYLLKKYEVQLRKESGLTVNRSLLEYYLSEKKSIPELAKLFRTTETAIKLILIRYRLDKGDLYSDKGELLNRFTDIQEQLLLGSLLGDGHLERHHGVFRFKEDHGQKQEEYSRYKHSILKNFINSEDVKKTNYFCKRDKKFRISVSFKTKATRIFEEYYNLFYNPLKYVNPHTLERINARGLAFWFMDDGTSYNSNGFELCTESFNKADLKLIQNYFKNKLGINTYLNKDGRVIITKENALIFQNLIKPYVLPIFYYKFIKDDKVSELEEEKDLSILNVDLSCWDTFSDIEKDRLINKVFNYYRIKGFPYFNLNAEEKICSFNKVKEFNYSNFLKEGSLKQVMHGLDLAWCYFPHAFNIRCNYKRSPLELFNEDQLFKKCLTKRLKKRAKITNSRIREALKTFSGSQGVSNFRPTVAKYIYDSFLPDGGVALDMSAGFGGRLLGALASKKLKKYIGLDPSSETFSGLEKIKEDFGYLNKEIELHKCGSETFISKEKVDLCFTSPPYFNTEHYSLEETQSYIKFPTKELWLNGFLKATLDNCYISIKDSGYLIININNVQSYPNLVDDFLILASEKYDLIKKYDMVLSSVGGGYKSEPIFIFKKRINL